MNKLNYFAATYTDFIKFDRKPNEDFYLVSEKLPIFVIADGVTQSHFREGKYEGEYAFPAGAKTAAQIFCYSVLEFLEEKLREKTNFENSIKKSFDLANQKIKELNIAEGIDKRLNYLEYDWFDCVGVLSFIFKNVLYYGYVGDCGLAIFDDKNQLKFQTKDMVIPAVERARKKHKNWENLPLGERVLIMHKDFRNRLDGKGYGAFSGETEVKRYYQIGSQNLNSGDLVVFYSDGFLNYFQFPEFIKILRKMVRYVHRKQDKKVLDEFTFQKAKENYERYGTDRTLISLEF